MFFCQRNYYLSYIDEPPTLYSLMQSIAPAGTPTRELWKYGREYFFNFKYNLEGIDKEFFEETVLNHYLTRRINYETAEMFRIQLQNKLIEVLPRYNLLFNNISVDIFDNGTNVRTTEEKEHYDDNSKEKNYTIENGNTNIANEQADSSTGNNVTENEYTKTDNNEATRKFSDIPQNFLEEIDNGNYVSEYEVNTANNTATDNGKNTSNSTQNTNSKGSNLTLSNNSRNYSNNKDSYYNKTITNKENVTSTSNKLNSIIKLEQEYISVFSLLYRDLDCLFFGLV